MQKPLRILKNVTDIPTYRLTYRSTRYCDPASLDVLREVFALWPLPCPIIRDCLALDQAYVLELLLKDLFFNLKTILNFLIFIFFFFCNN